MRTIDTPWGPFQVFNRDLIGKALERGEFWDAHLQPYLDQVQPGQLVVEVGAFIGFHTRYLMSRGVQVLAFEINPEVSALLLENTEAQDSFGRCSIVLYGLYDRVGFLDLLPQAQQLTNVSADLDLVESVGSLGYGPGVQKVYPVYPLHPELISPALALIKIDAQGCDLRVLEGCWNACVHHKVRPRILIEYEGKLAAAHGDTWVWYERWAREHQYTITWIPNVHAAPDFLLEPQG